MQPDRIRRFLLWGTALIAWTVLLVPVGTVLQAFLLVPPWSDEGRGQWWEGVFDLLSRAEWWGYGLIVCGIIAVTQFLFVLPVVRLRPPSGQRGRSLTVSLVLGALIAAGVTLALTLSVVELCAGLVTSHGQEVWDGSEMLDVSWVWPGVLLTLVGSWVGWTMLLAVFSRQLWADRLLGRLSVLLFGGTLVELLVVIPIDLMVRRRSDCYCMAGTFWALALSGVALLWLTGPGVVFALTAKRRRLARRTHCRGCGHARGPSPGAVCPECGHHWAENGP